MQANVSNHSVPEYIETVVVGAGQAGLATGYYLAQHRQPFIIVDAINRLGDNWRSHYDSLRLYSPAKVNKLPGMPFPAAPMAFPTRDDMAAYLESYAARFDLPVRTGVRVRRVAPEPGGGFAVHTDAGAVRCENVVVATGTFGRTPNVPAFATELDPQIVRLHSSEYRNAGQLRPGATLVVGASHSGSDIAYELASTGRPTVLSGPMHGEEPFDLDGRAAAVILPMFFWAARNVMSLSTPIGRRMRPRVRSMGAPLLRYKRRDLLDAGVEVTPERTVGVRDGRPVLGDGRRLDVANVIWCTGFRQDFGWIDAPVVGADGWPIEERGVVPTLPGLYFVGLAFQYSFGSMLVGGVGRDARYVVAHLAGHRAVDPRNRPAVPLGSEQPGTTG